MLDLYLKRDDLSLSTICFAYVLYTVLTYTNYEYTHVIAKHHMAHIMKTVEWCCYVTLI